MSSINESGTGLPESSDAEQVTSRVPEGFWQNLSELEASPEVREFIEREFPSQSEQTARLPCRGAGSCSSWVLRLPSLECREPLAVVGRRSGSFHCRVGPRATFPAKPRSTRQPMRCAVTLRGSWPQRSMDAPIKVDGNASHPYSGGASTAFAQASILELYDPDRSRGLTRSGSAADWKQFAKFAAELRDGLRGGGGKLRILSEASNSPTIAALRREIVATLPGTIWHEYEPLTRDNERAGTAMAFGQPHRVHLRLDKARVIAAFDADLFTDSPGPRCATRGTLESPATPSVEPWPASTRWRATTASPGP